jgi:dTDP-L-rhamnose 4-epimerase
VGIRVLITGGAGFIGSHLADELLEHGHRVRVLDSLVPQVHGPGATRPAYLNRDVELIVGDVRDRTAVRRALAGIDAVYHFAALVGVGQSMYEMARYTEVNGAGTAVLMEALIEQPVQRLVVASSMSLYGEGLYKDAAGALVTNAVRSPEQLRRGQWDPLDARGAPLAPVPTPETKPPEIASVYALSKFDQERLCLLTGEAYNIPTVALRFFNVYGTRQALSNPYTGVMAIFAARLLNDRPPVVFEDGLQQRDFVHVRDIAAACRLALERPVSGLALNVGSGRSVAVREIAARMGEAIGRPHIVAETTGQHRRGDIRHCFADITAARDALGYAPQVSFAAGLTELVDWLAGEQAIDRVDQARAELAARGLTA